MFHYFLQGIISEEDIESHSFDEINSNPATEPSQVSAEFRMLINEMKDFKREFDDCVARDAHDLSSFWLRKSKKPVLAVLLVRAGGGLKLFRGTNMEVSMPTGSLCAERNVIGSALAADVTLRRENLVAVAVLSASLDSKEERKQQQQLV